jgi:TolB-like protein/DNA-binding winged helix-turn-helix (wHTH) protein/Tfp pilus assembly protein PilF
MSNQQKHLYEFGPFRIDTVERLLLRGSEVIPLTPKAIDTLLALLAGRGHVLEKDDLMKSVWPDTFVEEGGPARNISLLRKAMGDDSDGGAYIETIPRRGYRFVAAVREISPDAVADPEPGPAADAPALSDLPPTPRPPTPPGRRTWLTGVTIGVLAAALITALFYLRPAKPLAGPAIQSLAVLPLDNLSNDKSQEYFADGMTEELITSLAKIGALRVISRTSVMAYKGVSNKRLPQIARELNVDAVVEGSVLRSGDRVRITAQLIDGKTEKHLWAESCEGDLRDVIALQSQVAGAIAGEIQVKLTSQEKARLARSRPINPEAYQDYLNGRFHWNMRTAQGMRTGMELFERAIQKDPGYATAYAGLADSYALLPSNAVDAMPHHQAMPLAKTNAAKALALDDTLAEAHTSLAYARLSYDWDMPSAYKEFLRAIELNPGYETAHHWYAHYLLAMGRLDDALVEMKRAQSLDPFSPSINVGVGWCLYYAKQYDQAIAQYRKALAMAPNFFFAHCAVGLAYQKKGLHSEAIAEFQKAVDLSGGNAMSLLTLGHAYAVAGRKDEARQQLQKLAALSQRQYVPALYFAFIYGSLGETDRAFEWVKKACDERSEYLVNLKVDPSLDDIRSDPRFPALLRRVGLAHE